MIHKALPECVNWELSKRIFVREVHMLSIRYKKLVEIYLHKFLLVSKGSTKFVEKPTLWSIDYRSWI